MRIYQFRATVVTAAGATSTTTLDVIGGICRQVLIVANTATTAFQPFITDDKGLEVSRYSLQVGEMSDITSIPMAGKYIVNITNASPDDTFKIMLGIQE